MAVYQVKGWSDCGWWIFKDPAGSTRAKLYYEFASECCVIREGRGFLRTASRFEYGNDADEKRLVAYIKETISPRK